MKTARNILWALFPFSILVSVIIIKAQIITKPIIGNILISIIFLLPITAMLMQTIMNKDKNVDSAGYLIKILFIVMLYVMVGFMFFFTYITIA